MHFASIIVRILNPINTGVFKFVSGTAVGNAYAHILTGPGGVVTVRLDQFRGNGLPSGTYTLTLNEQAQQLLRECVWKPTRTQTVAMGDKSVQISPNGIFSIQTTTEGWPSGVFSYSTTD